MKAAAKYLAALLAFILAGLGLSWSAVYGFWFAAHFFRSVNAVRICDALAEIILIPARLLFWLMSDIFDQSTPLSDPLFYAIVNGVLLGIIGYGSCRQWLFATKPRAGSARQTRSEPPR